MMAALTRMRGDPKLGLPKEHHFKYYCERAEDAGVVLTECIAVSSCGDCFKGALCAYNNDHKEGLTKLVEAVHKVGGIIFAQLFHCGRSSNKETLGVQPVSCSDILNRSYKYDQPLALSKDGIKDIINKFKDSIQMCKDAGFDGVELHGANGYIIDQFLRDSTNTRTDEYGGSVENRSKFLLEIIDEGIKIFGNDRIGVKLSPTGRFNDMYDSNPKELTEYLFSQLNKRKILFVEFMRAPDLFGKGLYEINGDEQYPEAASMEGLKKMLPDVLLIGNTNYTPEDAEKQILEGKIDMVSMGRNYMSNPDYCERLKNGWEIDAPDFSSGWGPHCPELGPKGYSDFPKYKDKVKF
jgi:2,4-dienoyl-CoA reductase-like NADH-dependent reductase (Old Yellow Enzyme family)